MPSKPPPRIENPLSGSDSDSDSDSGSSTEGEEEEEIEDTPEDESLQQTQKQVVRTPLKNPNSRSNANSNSNPTPNSASAPNPSSDSSEEEGDESESADSGSDSDSPPLDIKPLSSKPMHQAPKTPSGVSSGSVKRRLETEEKSPKKEPKRKKVSELAAGGDGPGKKPAGESQPRPWNDEDEIMILKGLVDFRRRGKDISHVTELYNSIKHLVRPGISIKQFDGKIRTIKGRYDKALKNVAINGADPKFSKPHDAEVYRLSKKVWAPAGSIDNEPETLQLVAKKSESEESESESESESDSESVVPDSPPKPKAATLPDNSPVVNAKQAPVVSAKQAPVVSAKQAPVVSAKQAPVVNAKQAPVVNAKQAPVVSAKQAPVVSAKQAPVVNGKQASTVKGKQAPMVNGKQDSESISEYTFLNASILPRDLPTPPLGLGELFQKGGWNLMGASTAAKFDKRWKNLVIAEAKAYLERIDLVREQTQAMLDVLQSTDI